MKRDAEMRGVVTGPRKFMQIRTFTGELLRNLRSNDIFLPRAMFLVNSACVKLCINPINILQFFLIHISSLFRYQYVSVVSSFTYRRSYYCTCSQKLCQSLLNFECHKSINVSVPSKFIKLHNTYTNDILNNYQYHIVEPSFLLPSITLYAFQRLKTLSFLESSSIINCYTYIVLKIRRFAFVYV